MLSMILGTAGDPPAWCFKPNAQGELPTCTESGGEWHRSYDGGMGMGGGADGIPDVFLAFMVVVVALGIAATVWRVSTARTMARRAGLDEDDAARMAMFTDNGLETTYLASAMRQRDQVPPPPPTEPPTQQRGDVAERLRRLDRLREEELVSTEEWAERRKAILDEL